jgi:YVTN family beta-propeller protein
MPALILVVLAALGLQQGGTQSPQAAAAAKVAAENAAKLDFEFYRTSVEPIFLTKRAGNVRCVSCHGGSASSQFRLQPLPDEALSYTEEQSRKNFESVARFVAPGGSPLASRLLKHPLSRTAGGDPFHGGGQHWQSQNDPEWQILAAWVKGERPKPLPTRVRIIQTNAAGDNTHVIDPATNKVVGVINDIEIPHGVTAAPDGSRIYISNEHLHSLDAVNSTTLKVIKRIKLSGRPNNVAISKDGRKVYVGIAQAPGALDVIDTQTLTNVKTVPVAGSIHNVYVTPDGQYAVAGSIGQRTISIVDTATDEMVRKIELSAGIRPMTFDTNPDGSTRNIYVQLSNFHGFVAVDFATGKETHRIEHPPVPGAEAHRDGLQGAPAHGLGVAPDGKTLWSTSKVYGYAYVHSLPDLKEIGRVFVGQHPEWVTFTPDGRFVYVAAAGDNMTFVVDVKTMKEVARIPVGQVPKRNGTALMQTN